MNETFGHERNFCERCGKRLGKNAWDVHTCSPPENAPPPSPRNWKEEMIEAMWREEMIEAMKQPEALRLADAIDLGQQRSAIDCINAAAELRRLHEENERLKAVIAEAEKQEPVAWMDDFGNAFPLAANKGAGSWMDEHKRNWKPLYTSPPQRRWVGLTESEIIMCSSVSILRFYDAIEAKLKQKNGFAEEKNT